MNDFFEIDDPEPPPWEERRPPTNTEPVDAPAAEAPPSNPYAAPIWPAPGEPTEQVGWGGAWGAAAEPSPPPASDPAARLDDWPGELGEIPDDDDLGRPLDEHPHHSHHSHNPLDRATRGLPHALRVAVDWIVTIVGAVAIVLAIKAWVVNPYRIPTPSMEPTLHCARSSAEPDCRGRFSDRVLANRFIYHLHSPHRGDIVVFKAPERAKTLCSSGEGDVFVKRIVGMPGDRITERNGWIYIDGKKLKEPYLRPEVHVQDKENSFRGPITVPKGQYEMMGDNRNESCDSRTWGSVPRRSIIGKVFMTYWPPNRVSFH